MAVTVFGYLILISIEFDDFISLFSPQLQFRLRRCIKHSSQCLAKFPNASKFVQNTSRHVFSNLFRVFGNVNTLNLRKGQRTYNSSIQPYGQFFCFQFFGNVVKQSLPCIIYYFLIKYVQYYVILSFGFLPTMVTKLRNSISLTSFSKLCFFYP